MKNSKKNNKKEIAPIDIAKMLGVEDRYLNVLVEHEMKQNFIENELKKTEEDFFNGDFVDLPK